MSKDPKRPFSLWRCAKRVLAATFVFLFILVIATTVTIKLSGDPDFRYVPPETLVNDVTQMNPTYVGKVLRPKTVEEVSDALRNSTGPVSIGGGRYSQGGQVSYPDSLHLDMRELNQVVRLEPAEKRITVQSGATWRQIQQVIDPANLSIRIMQTYSNFTVGGSLSVNVHGRYIGEGPLVRSVESLRIVLADGSVVQASPTENAEIFYGAIGGYGGLGVIVEATLSLADNEKVERQTRVMPVGQYAAFFRQQIRDNPAVVFHNTDLYPPDFTTGRQVSWLRTGKPLTEQRRLIPQHDAYKWQPRIAGWVADYSSGKWLRQHVIDPRVYSDERVVWRNFEASYDVAELEPPSRDETSYGLREYFVPVERFDEFVPRMREIFRKHRANILNVSVRHALPDTGTLLAWARHEVFAFVVYYRQGRSAQDRQQVAAWSRELIDAATSLGGAYYLPYQVYESPAQFHAAFPRDGEYFALKQRLDPQNRFRNRLWQQLYPGNADALEARRQQTPDYNRDEEQTVLTLPEWYLVFNPQEYARYLKSGRNPSDFPYLASIDEYWSLYDRATGVVRASHYPRNAEYLTMLKVIGASTTAEYLFKGAWENSIGRLTSWSAYHEQTQEDRLYASAQSDYAQFIVDKAWYEFRFMPWVAKTWTQTPFFGRHMLRKLERKVFVTLEFSVKAIYAKLIGFASHSAYGIKAQNIYFTVRAPTPDAALPPGVTRVAQDGNRWILTSLRWGPFSEAVQKLAASGFEFEDISGNRRIVLTAVGPQGAAVPGTSLFTSRMVTDPALQRQVQLVSVSQLRGALQQLQPAGAETSKPALEHLYDY